MLELLLDKHILGILMGASVVLGVICKLVAGLSIKRLLRASGNMSKSEHPLIRLVKAKFEHACMVSDRVQNVDVFVEKYLYEYRAGGLKLHTWRRLEKAGVWLCLLCGLSQAAAWYALYGMGDPVIRYGAAGAGGAILLFLFQLTSDEKYQLEVIKNYMVDHLENVCAHRYEKNRVGRSKEERKVMAVPAEKEEPEEEERAARQETAFWPPEESLQKQERNQPVVSMSKQTGEQTEEREEIPPVQPAVPEQTGRPMREQPVKEARASRPKPRKEEEEVSREVRIREILEEFLA